MKCSTSSVTFEIIAMSLYHTIEYRMFVAQFTKPLLAKVSCSQVVTLKHFYSDSMCDDDDVVEAHATATNLLWGV